MGGGLLEILSTACCCALQFVFGGRSAEEGQDGSAFNDVWVLDWGKKAWSVPAPLRAPHSPLCPFWLLLSTGTLAEASMAWPKPHSQCWGARLCEASATSS